MRGRATLVVLLTAAAAQAQDDPDYPLGRLGVPPITLEAEPLRLTDLAVGFTEDGATTSRFESRLKLRDFAFFGAEIAGERKAAFFDTQRLELGTSYEDGRVGLEGTVRAPRVLMEGDAVRRRDTSWRLALGGTLRLSPDWELPLGYEHDTDPSRGGPPSLPSFIETGVIPPPDRATRVRRRGRAGVRYQRENHLELEAFASVAKVRTQAGFDQDRSRVQGAGIWNGWRLELQGQGFIERIAGRAGRSEAMAELNVRIRLGDHLVASAGTRQDWQPGVERSVRAYRGGLTFFGRRFRFARASAIGREVLRVTRMANALGYNERRVYDIAGLRALRDRLSISPARRTLASDVEELYRAQVRERNVPQLGVELERGVEEIPGSETTRLRAFVGIPWRLAWPFARGEERVEFIRMDYSLSEQTFPSLGWKSRDHVVTASVELDRQHVLQFRWESPGQTPEERALRRRRSRRVSIDYVYALGR